MLLWLFDRSGGRIEGVHQRRGQSDRHNASWSRRQVQPGRSNLGNYVKKNSHACVC